MQVFHKAEDLRQSLASGREKGAVIGFVPTMGALHQGHLNLVEEAQGQSDVVVVSIFVNPTQFNNSSDLANYPRLPQKDIALLRQQGVQVAFMPTEDEVYPHVVESESFGFNGLDEVMEGAFRPGHFKGVATVVKRFFEMVRPHLAFFGEKDFQQLQIIRALVKQQALPVRIRAVPTQRSEKGLALSSRNALLSAREREEALLIYNSLMWAKSEVAHQSPEAIVKGVKQRFAGSSLRLEYVQIADEENLQPVTRFKQGVATRIFLAAYAGQVRLIDNVSLI